MSTSSPVIRRTTVHRLVVLLLGLILPISGLQAQQIPEFNLEFLFGPDDAAIVRQLERQGYRDIRIINRKITRTRVQACQGNTRVELDIAPNGRITPKGPVGRCGGRIDQAEARRILERSGYSDIDLERVRDGFQGSACRQGVRSAVFIGNSGQIRQLQPMGDCWQMVPREQVRAALKRQGYDRIRFADFPPPPYVVTACKGARQMEVIVAADGRIWREQQIGQCDPVLTTDQVAAILRNQGYRRIKFVNETPPFIAEACKGNNKMELTVGRRGRLRQERRIGTCAKPLTPVALRRKLGSLGYSRIVLQEENRMGYLVHACERDNRVTFHLSHFGAIRRKSVVGYCEPETLDAVRQDMRQQGLKNMRFFVEACDRGKKFRIGINEFGGQVSRKEIGSCR